MILFNLFLHFKNRFRVVKTLLPVFFRWMVFAGVCLSYTAVNAQQLQPAPWNDPAIVWMTPSQAGVKLQAELNQIQPPLANLTPGTPSHTDLLRRILLYKAILRSAQNNIPVPQAIESALPEAASLGGLYEQSFTPEATLRALYDEAQALLTI